MTPDEFGYVRCVRCKTWRRPEHMVPMESGGWGVCTEVPWCSAQAGAGKGALDADTGGDALDGAQRHQGGSEPCRSS